MKENHRIVLRLLQYFLLGDELGESPLNGSVADKRVIAFLPIFMNYFLKWQLGLKYDDLSLWKKAADFHELCPKMTDRFEI